MTRADPQINLRLPQELKARLEAVAANNRRSLTAEIVKRLQESFDPVEGEHIDMRGVTAETLAYAVAEGIKLARHQAAQSKQTKDGKKAITF